MESNRKENGFKGWTGEWHGEMKMEEKQAKALIQKWNVFLSLVPPVASISSSEGDTSMETRTWSNTCPPSVLFFIERFVVPRNSKLLPPHPIFGFTRSILHSHPWSETLDGLLFWQQDYNTCDMYIPGILQQSSPCWSGEHRGLPIVKETKDIFQWFPNSVLSVTLFFLSFFGNSYLRRMKEAEEKKRADE